MVKILFLYFLCFPIELVTRCGHGIYIKWWEQFWMDFVRDSNHWIRKKDCQTSDLIVDYYLCNLKKIFQNNNLYKLLLKFVFIYLYLCTKNPIFGINTRFGSFSSIFHIVVQCFSWNISKFLFKCWFSDHQDPV